VFVKDNQEQTSTKDKSVKAKTQEIADLKSDVVDLKEDLDAAETKHKSALQELEKLHTMCVAEQETYAERVAKRQQEIEALKQAHTILEEWKN